MDVSGNVSLDWRTEKATENTSLSHVFTLSIIGVLPPIFSFKRGRCSNSVVRMLLSYWSILSWLLKLALWPSWPVELDHAVWSEKKHIRSMPNFGPACSIIYLWKAGWNPPRTAPTWGHIYTAEFKRISEFIWHTYLKYRFETHPYDALLAGNVSLTILGATYTLCFQVWHPSESSITSHCCN